MPIRLAEVKLGSYEATVVANSRYGKYFMLLQVFFFLLTCFESSNVNSFTGPLGGGWVACTPPPPPPTTDYGGPLFF